MSNCPPNSLASRGVATTWPCATTNLGIGLIAVEKYAEAEKSLRVAQRLYVQLAAELPNEPLYRNNIAANHLNLSRLPESQLKAPDAWRVPARHSDFTGNSSTDFPACLATAMSWRLVSRQPGNLLDRWDSTRRPRRFTEPRSALREQLVADFPGAVRYALEIGSSYRCLGDVISHQGKPQESLDWFSKAFRRSRTVAQE